MIGIYKITSPSNRVYVGQSVNIEQRISKYKILNNCKNQIKLYNSFLKYGTNKHVFEIIEECNIELLNEKERYWQDFYNVLNNGLNCKLTRTKDKSGKHSEETKLNQKKGSVGKNKGRKLSEEQKKFISNLNKGRVPHNKGIYIIYKYNCKICGIFFESRSKSRKMCSAKCRDDNNKICNEKRKKFTTT